MKTSNFKRKDDLVDYLLFQRGVTEELRVGAKEEVSLKDRVAEGGGKAGKEIGKRKMSNETKEEVEKWGLHIFLSSPLNQVRKRFWISFLVIQIKDDLYALPQMFLQLKWLKIGNVRYFVPLFFSDWR